MRLTARQAASLNDFIWLKRGTYQATQLPETFFPAVPEASTVDTGLPVPENLANQLPAQNPAGWYPSPEYPQWGDLNPGNFFGPGQLGPQVDGARPGCCEPKGPEDFPFFTVGEANALEAGNSITTAENLNLDPLWATSGSDYQNVDPSRQWGSFSEDFEVGTNQFGIQGMRGLRGLGATAEATSEVKEKLTKQAAALLEASQNKSIPVQNLPAVESGARAVAAELARYQPWTANFWNYYESSQVIRENTQATISNIRIRQGVKDGAILGRSQQDLSPTAQMAAQADRPGGIIDEYQKTASNAAYAIGKATTRISNAAYNMTATQAGQDKAIDSAKTVTYILAGIVAVGVVGYALSSVVKVKEAFGG